MKRQLSHANIFSFQLIGAMAGAMSVIYPLVAGAESTTNSESEQNKQNKSNKASTENKASKSTRKYNRSKQLVEALEAVSQNQTKQKNLIALNKAEDINLNLPASLQQLVDERNYAAEYILTALKTSDNANDNLPSSLQKLVEERNSTAESTLIALNSAKKYDSKLSLVQKLKLPRTEISKSKQYLVSLEQSQYQNILLEEDSKNAIFPKIASNLQRENVNIEDAEYTVQENVLLVESDKELSHLSLDRSLNSSNGNYLLALEPFLNEQKQQQFPINSNGNYLLALEPFLNEQKPQEFPINSNGNYLLALEPFLEAQKLAESAINNTSEEKTDVTEWFSRVNSTLVSINVFESLPNSQPPENSPTLIAKSWNTNNLTDNTYKFSSLVAIQSSSVMDNSTENSSETLLSAGFNSFNSDKNGSQSLNPINT